MTYSDKVKKSKVLLEAIKSLKDKETIKVVFGKDYNNKPQGYVINCSVWTENSDPVYSIYKDEPWSTSGMNIESLTNTQAKAYSYDMMSQKTTFNFPLHSMEIVKEKVAKQN